ncbi:MAG: hypothetical protein WBX05_16865 [Pseudolabrys sp.]|jgi:hypothetical protein
MHTTSGNRLKNLAAACLFSCFIAGGISLLTSPVTADNAAVVTISVNRAIKGDRLPLPPMAQPIQHNSISEKPIPRHTPLNCEPAFSPIAEPAQAHVLKYCLA